MTVVSETSQAARRPALRADITALRALAVTLVVLFHFHIRPFSGGFIGVDVFFVISGYLMTKIIASGLQADRFDYLRFLGNRIARIWPALLVLLATLLVVGGFLLAPLDYANLAGQATSAALFYSNLHYAKGIGYFTTATDERWLLHTWSLSVEWQFYMLYPAILFAIERFVRTRKRLSADGRANALLVSLAVLAAASLAASVVLTRSDQSQAFFSLLTRAWEMFAGGLALLIEPKAARLGNRPRLGIAVVGVACIVASAALAARFDWEAAWPGALALLPVIGTAIVLAVGTAPSIQSRRLITNVVVQKIGLWSYSIYLWHWPFAVGLGFLTLDGNAKRVAKLAAIALSLLLAFASYSLVETRVKMSKGGFFQRVTIGSIVMALLVAAASIAIVRSDGWIQRAGDDLAFYRKIERIANDHSAQEPCNNYQKQRDALIVCPINPQATGKRVLVYGDSHAGHLYPWFLKRATVGVDFLTGPGCPPVPGFNRRMSGFRCPEYLEAALSRAAEDQYTTIVISGNWGVGMDEQPSGLCRSIDGQCAPGTPPANRADLVDANVAAWRHLLELGKTVVLVDQSPVAYFEILPTVMRRRFLGLTPPATFAEMVPINAGPVSYLDDVVARLPASPNLHRIALRPELCDQDRCRTMDDRLGIPALSDQSHFVPEWMEQHGNAFRAFAVAR